MKKVLHLRWGEKIGGVETILKDIAKFSDRSQFESIFCFLKGGGVHEKFIREQNCQVITIPAKSGFDLLARWKLFLVIRAIRPDVVIEHGVPPLIRPIIWLAGQFPIITYDHGCFELYKIKGKHLSNWLIKLEYIFFSDCIVTNSRYNKKSIVDNYKVKNKEVHVIYPGVDITLFSLRKFATDSSKLKIAYVGRIQFGDKGTDLLVQVASELNRLDFLSFEINIIGNGPDMEALVALVENASLKSFFNFHGEVDNVPARLSEIDVVLVTSKSEAFGLSPLEALAAGCYVVGFDVGGLNESVGQCKQAVLISPFHTDSMAAAIIAIGSNIKHRVGSAILARRYVEENFLVNSFVSQLESLVKGKLKI